MKEERERGRRRQQRQRRTNERTQREQAKEAENNIILGSFCGFVFGDFGEIGIATQNTNQIVNERGRGRGRRRGRGGSRSRSRRGGRRRSVLFVFSGRRSRRRQRSGIFRNGNKSAFEVLIVCVGVVGVVGVVLLIQRGGGRGRSK
jgi:hypothetical protein